MNIENLTKLAYYLESGKLKAKFSMGAFSGRKDSSITHCGAVGCAVGHGPYAGIPKTHQENWDEYSVRAFALYDRNEWNWCFGHEWTYYQPTAAQAAQRIRYLLKKGSVPNYWLYAETITNSLIYPE